jgi:hypothetical protein
LLLPVCSCKEYDTISEVFSPDSVLCACIVSAAGDGDTDGEARSFLETFSTYETSYGIGVEVNSRQDELRKAQKKMDKLRSDSTDDEGRIRNLQTDLAQNKADQVKASSDLQTYIGADSEKKYKYQKRVNNLIDKQGSLEKKIRNTQMECSNRSMLRKAGSDNTTGIPVRRSAGSTPDPRDQHRRPVLISTVLVAKHTQQLGLFYRDADPDIHRDQRTRNKIGQRRQQQGQRPDQQQRTDIQRMPDPPVNTACFQHGSSLLLVKDCDAAKPEKIFPYANSH